MALTIVRGLLLRALSCQGRQRAPPQGALRHAVRLRLGGCRHRSEDCQQGAGGGHDGGHSVGGILHLHQEHGVGRGREPDAGLQMPPGWERRLLPPAPPWRAPSSHCFLCSFSGAGAISRTAAGGSAEDFTDVRWDGLQQRNSSQDSISQW